MKKQRLALHKLSITSFVTDTEQTDLLGGAKRTHESCQYTCNYTQCGTGYETIFTCPVEG